MYKKILLIAYRDFLSRVRNKTFLISTLLLPIAVVIFYGAMFFFIGNDSETYIIGVRDAQNRVKPELSDDDNFKFLSLSSNFDINDKKAIEAKNLNAVIDIPESEESLMAGKFKVTTFSKLGLLTKSKLENTLQDIIEKKRFQSYHLDTSDVSKINKLIDIEYKNESGMSDNELREGIAFGISYLLGFMMYIILIIYGAQVMRGVMEEKTNRIVEIIISSVRPFELLLGKIIGIGMVSLVQLMFWGIFMLIINLSMGFIIGGNMTDMSSSSAMQPAMMKMANNPELINVFNNLKSIQFGPIIGLFIFYFLGGYFLYSSLFAMVGSAVGDDPQDAQSMMFPIMMPIIISMIFLTKSVNNPNGTEAIIASMVPFTSPIVMMSRVAQGIPEGVPVWQLVISMTILLLTTVLLIFLAARIYKVGILMYGKKMGWKDMVKWVFVK